MLAVTTLANSDYVSISLVLAILGAIVSALKMHHSAKTEAAELRRKDREADTARHHELDKRIDRQEQRAELAPAVDKMTAVLERILEREQPRGSGVYPRRPSDGD